MNVTKEVIICWLIAALLIIAGTSTDTYIFEILAIIMLVFSYIISLFIKPKKKLETTKGEKINAEK